MNELKIAKKLIWMYAFVDRVNHAFKQLGYVPSEGGAFSDLSDGVISILAELSVVDTKEAEGFVKNVLAGNLTTQEAAELIVNGSRADGGDVVSL